MASWAKTLSRELAKDNILINNVCPGRIDTERHRKLSEDRAGRLNRPLEEIENQNKALDLTIKETEAQVEQEVRQAFYELEVASENSAALKENIALAQKALEIARVQYEAGVITNMEELDAELSALSAQTAYFASVSGYLIARARLEKAVGATIE